MLEIVIFVDWLQTYHVLNAQCLSFLLEWKLEDGAAHLNPLVEQGQEGSSLFDKHQCSELWAVVLEEEFSIF